jgi:hypothetical protein
VRKLELSSEQYALIDDALQRKQVIENSVIIYYLSSLKPLTNPVIGRGK